MQFGLQFETAGSENEDEAEDTDAAEEISLPVANAKPDSADSASNAADPAQPSQGAEVVRLDRFRKK